MRFHHWIPTLCFIAVMAAAPVPTVRAQESGADPLQQIMVRSGLQRQFEVLPEFIGAVFAARLSKDPKATAEQGGKVREIITRAFDAAQLSSAYRLELERGLTPPEREAVLAWLTSPLGARITRLETGVATGRTYQQMKSQAPAADDPAAAPRVQIITDLVDAGRLSEARVSMKRSIFQAVARFSDMLNGQPPLSDRDLAARYEPQDKQMTITVAREVVVSALYIYQSLTDEELSRYRDFYRSPAGAKYAAVCRQSFAKVFDDALGETLQQIREVFTAPAPSPAAAP